MMKHKKISKQPAKDKRFSSAEYDPKFTPVSKKVSKVKLDNRFKKMLSDSRFSMNSAVDKYGRNIQNQEQNQQLMQYYYQDQSQQEANKISQWMENYNEESSEDLEDIQYDQLLDEEEESLWEDEKVIKNQGVKPSKRLALCNYDWMNISSKDLMLLFSSFKPTTGSIKEIKVYYSNYGLEKMKNQEMNGPEGIWQERQQKQGKKSWKQLLLDKKEEGTFNQIKLRAYQKQRLKYCFAVIVCNDVKTADQLYHECDGQQFQNSNLNFDLRFIPDEMKFNQQSLKEQSSQIPSHGEVKNFVNRAMGHSKVTLTWQDPQLTTIANLKKKNWNQMNEEQLDKVDWGMYLNQQQLSEDQQRAEIFQSKDRVVSDWRDQCNKKKSRNNEIQITFEQGFNSSKKQPKQSLKKQLKTRKQRQKLKKQEKIKNRQKLDLLVEKQEKRPFTYDANDDRFDAVFTNPIYAIDPVNKSFDHRKTGQVFREVVKRNRRKNLQ